MRLIKSDVEIMDDIDGKAIMEKIERCGRVCYKSENKITEGSAERFIKNIIARGHESVLEHVSITVKFICDRGVSHEIVRHRHSSYSQESTRYCNYYGKHIDFILPDWLDLDCGYYVRIRDKFLYSETGNYTLEPLNHDISGTVEEIFLNACANGESGYSLFVKKDCPPEQARQILPNALKTELVMTCNLREWRQMLRMRCAKAAHPDTRRVALMLYDKLHAALPVVFDESLVPAEKKG